MKMSQLQPPPGFLEFSTYMNLMGSPMARGIAVYRTLAEWANAEQIDDPKAQELGLEFMRLVTNVKTELWKPLPGMPSVHRPQGK